MRHLTFLLPLLAACGPANEAEALLNQQLRTQYPDGWAPSSLPEVDPADEEEPDGFLYPVWPGQRVAPTVRSAEIDTGTAAICIGFGSPANAWCIPADDPDVTVTDGQASVQLEVPPEICNDLSDICHDIKCYEFAQTAAGTFTASDVEWLAAACGSCDEPSCQDLIGECDTGMCLVDDDCADGEACLLGNCVGGGALRFYVTWSSATDFDLYVTTPAGSTLGYAASSSADGGTWDYDDTTGGSGAAENIFFDSPADGTYEYWVNHYGGASGSFTLAVVQEGTVVATHTESLSSGESTHWTLAVSGLD